MSKLPFFILTLLSIVMCIATFVENYLGTSFAGKHIYGTWWFSVLWGIAAIASVPVIIKQKLWRRLPAFLLHTALIIMLGGALTTHLTSTTQPLHLRKGKVSNMLPYSITLSDFSINYYPGTNAPQDFISTFSIDGVKAVTSMNKPFCYQGYRFFQTSYDEDMQGTLLTVNYDPYGTPITYAGYALFALSALLLIIKRWTGRLRLTKGAVIAIAMCQPCLSHASMRCIDSHLAEKERVRQVVYNNRICPLNTPARDFTIKLTGKPSFQGKSAECVLLSWTAYPEDWQYVKMIRTSKSIQRFLGLESSLACFADFFDADGYYLLADATSIGDNRMKASGITQKELREINERIGLVVMLTQGTLVQEIKDGTQPLTDGKVCAEILYNTIPITTILFCSCLTLAILGFTLPLFRRYRLDSIMPTDKTRLVLRLMTLLITTVLMLHIGLRWYISGHLPLSNGFETMEFVALCALVMGCASSNQRASLMIAGFTLLVAHLTEKNPQITSLMPVLHSPWLASHVSIIMISYAMFAMLTVKYDVRILETATLLLAIGIFLGAVWANQSWGTYWSWDAKEVWALITMFAYCMPLHAGCLPWFRDERHCQLYVRIAFFTVLMTYFGCNYVLTGMHSYA